MLLKYNYIFFTESYPVIPEEIMIDMMKKSKNLLKPGGKVTALSKTVKKKGFEMVKQRLHRSVLYRLKTDSGLIKEDVTITKEE
jgi:hypothetical protein